MAKLLYFIVCLSVIFGMGYSLKCYKCTHDTMNGCTKTAKPAPTEFTCPPAPANKEAGCYYVTSYDTAKKTYKADSNCVETPAGSGTNVSVVAQCNKVPGFDQKECRVCKSDLCNSGSLFSTSLITLMCLPIIFIFSKMLFH